MAIRYVRFAIPAVAAGARTNPTNVATFDDNAQRTMRGYLSTNQTKLIHAQVDIAGRVFADLDGGVQAQQRDWIPLDQTYPPGTLFSVNVINDSAGALGVNTDAIVFKYETGGPVVAPPTVPG